MIASMPHFLDQEHLRAFLIDVIRLCLWLLILAAIFLPLERFFVLHPSAERGRMGWQKASGYNKRSRVETAIGRYEQVIEDGLRFRKDGCRATEVGVAVELGRPISVRIK